MEEKIVNAGSDVAEKVIEQTAENLDYNTLKYLGAFGLGAVAGITAYRKLMVPAWSWMREKWENRKNVVKEESETPVEEAEDLEDSTDETDEK